MTNTTHFGYQTVAEEDKVHKVAEVFHSVAAKYDLMNDFMSAGLHRVWKAFTIAQAGIRPGFKVLDIAGGTGDLSKAFAKKAGPSGEVWLTDINESMLRVGRDRLLNKGIPTPTLLCDAESYRYLAESIRMHPDQETLKQMMQDVGLERVEYFNLSAGVAALHTGIKL